MKFRGMMVDLIPMKEFNNVIITMSKLAKEAVLRITEDKLYFIVSDEENGPRKPSVWCELPAKYYFLEYHMEGISEEYNEIYLEFSPALFARSLSTLRQAAKTLKLKLTNKSSPCLTVEIELPSEAMQSQQCVHDIPVKVITRRLWSEYQEPEELNYNISIEIAGLKAIKNIVERLKSLSQFLIISADQTGRLTLTIETTLGSVAAHFPNLEIQSYSGSSEDESGDDGHKRLISARVDIKRIYMFLCSQQISYRKVYCGIVSGSLVRFYLEHPDAVKLQCYVPEISR